MSVSRDERGSGGRHRTRRAILRAAAGVLARDRTATLADVAAAADVGRTTLHRYFPDRNNLVNAAVAASLQAVDQAIADAALDQGTPREAMRRLVAALVSVGDQLVFLFGDPRVLQDYGGPGHDGLPPPDDPVIALIGRGQADGQFDPDLSPAWVLHVLWALVYTGCEEADKGRLSRHGITETVVRTLENGIHRSPPVEDR